MFSNLATAGVLNDVDGVTGHVYARQFCYPSLVVFFLFMLV